MSKDFNRFLNELYYSDENFKFLLKKNKKDNVKKHYLFVNLIK